MAVLTENAPAKINLTLNVLGRRADGYHELTSLVVFARDVADRVILDTSRAESFSVSGPFAGSIEGQNLVLQVIAAAKVACPDLVLGAFELVKNLPVASGIGGGSADAAAALRLIQRANSDLAATIDWPALAARAGADVPVCLACHPAMMSGAGETLRPVAILPRLTAVLVNPMAEVPRNKTAQVFAALAAKPLAADTMAAQVPILAGRDAVLEYMAGEPNSLTAAACAVVPEIVTVLAALDSLPACRMARLSGAGPTCFGIFDHSGSAEDAVHELRARYPHWWVARSNLG